MRAIDSSTAFVTALAQLQLLEPEQLQETAGPLQARCTNLEELILELQKRGWLTSFQVERLLEGQGQELVLGAYHLLDRLGEGGMGQVYKARHAAEKRLVALKVIRPQFLARPDFARRFHREILAATRLAHPNIVVTHGAERVENRHFLVMDFYEGLDLGRMVRRSGPLPVGRACAYLRQAALGLQHVHEQGMVHRDVKPENLLVALPPAPEGDAGVVKILDLGLARVLRQSQRIRVSTPLTQEGMILGTPDFIAPEQTKNVRFPDIRSDLYSLGCTFYFVLSGQVPFPGGTPIEKLLRHRMEQPLPLERLRPDVPAPVLEILEKLLAKNPAERFQTPAQLATALAPFAAPAGGNSLSLQACGLESVADTLALAFTENIPLAPLPLPPTTGKVVLPPPDQGD